MQIIKEYSWLRRQIIKGNLSINHFTHEMSLYLVMVESTNQFNNYTTLELIRLYPEEFYQYDFVRYNQDTKIPIVKKL